MAINKIKNRQRIRYRIRKKISGTAGCPRLCVFRSNKQIYAQIVDDEKKITLLAASSAEKELKAKTKKDSKTEQAKLVGAMISEKAKKAGIKKVVFDRSGYLFHGRVKAFADAARSGGLEF